MNRHIIGFFASTFLLSVCALNFAESQITQTKIVASDGNGDDSFGWSVSVHGDRALVGAFGDDDNGSNAGSAYVFHFDGSNWVEQAKLNAGEGDLYDQFGQSVALHGDFAFVGARSDDLGLDAGSVSVFHFDGSDWVEQTELTASDGEAGDRFGTSVAVSGEYALIGADDDNGGGSAYIFHFDGSTWVEQAKIIASDREGADYFGNSVSISGNYALVGAWLDDNDEPNSNSGSAYVFYFDGTNWVEQTKITASDGEGEDNFGKSVSISGNYALVGADQDDDNGPNSGSAYVFYFDGSNWVEQVKLTPRDPLSRARFGKSVSLSDNYALIGTDSDSTGSAYVFFHDGTGWMERTRLVAGDGADEDHFGFSVSLSGDYAMVGAHGVNADGGAVGAVYSHTASALCSKFSQFQARCRTGGLIKARVTMSDASHAGKVIEISIDDVPYEVTIDATGRGQLSQGGFSPGPHTVELTNPGQCFDPIVVTCRTSLDKESSDDWDSELISETPTETALVGNYPNPFNPSTTFSYTLSEPGQVSLRVYNTLGQLVRTIVDQEQVGGHHEAVWDGRNEDGGLVSSGIYIYRMNAGAFVETKRMMLLK